MLRQSVLRVVGNFGSIKQFKLPDLGEKIKEAVVKSWHVKVGDKVEEFQPVADVATDKMFTQIPSSYQGRVHKIFHELEQTCQVGEVFLEIDVDEEPATTPAPTKPDVTPPVTHTDHTTTNPSNEWVLASPSVRRMAREKKIDLAKVKGSGKDGRVLPEDLEQKEQTLELQKQQEPVIQKQQSQTSATPITAQSVTIIKMDDFQKGMQKSMTESNTIPTLYLKDEFDLTTLTEFRKTIKKELDLPLTFMSFFIKAFSMALTKYPIVNSTYDPSKPFEFKQHQSHNISIALDSPKGLVVPNLKNCQEMNIKDIHYELQRLRDLGSKGKLGGNELLGGTVCISNIGTIGGTYTGPLILPPQACIVGLGRVQVMPRYDRNMVVVPKQLMNVSFGCDHRVLDGATVARFSNQWKSYLENPVQMLVDLK